MQAASRIPGTWQEDTHTYLHSRILERSSSHWSLAEIPLSTSALFLFPGESWPVCINCHELNCPISARKEKKKYKHILLKIYAANRKSE